MASCVVVVDDDDADAVVVAVVVACLLTRLGDGLDVAGSLLARTIRARSGPDAACCSLRLMSVACVSCDAVVVAAADTGVATGDRSVCVRCMACICRATCRIVSSSARSITMRFWMRESLGHEARSPAITWHHMGARHVNTTSASPTYAHSISARQHDMVHVHLPQHVAASHLPVCTPPYHHPMDVSMA